MINLVYIFLLILPISCAIYIFFTVYSISVGSPFVPVPWAELAALPNILSFGDAEVLMDFGSGDGRVLRFFAPHVVRAVGYEINPILYWWSKFRLVFLGRKVRVVRRNYWFADCSVATLLFVYLGATHLPRLVEKITREMRPGTRVISYIFPLPHWQYDHKIGKMYLYTIN